MCYDEVVRIFFAISLFLSGVVWSEDERSFVGPKTLFPAQQKKILFKHFSPEYLVDLTADGKKERIRFVNEDGKDGIVVADFHGKSIFRHDFRAVGLEATPYKILFRSLSASSKVLVIHYYEGYTDYLKFTGSSRLYFLTFEKNDLKTFSMYRGPSVFYEQAEKNKSYRRRNYKVKLVDFNGDGRKDVLVQYSGIKDVFLYKGKGDWLHLTRPEI